MGIRRDSTHGTLERLNDALNALEGRMGMQQRQSARPHDDFAAIRARQSALEAPYAHGRASAYPTHQAAPRSAHAGIPADALRSELQSLRADLEREMAGSVSAGFDAVRNDLISMQKRAAQNNGLAGSGSTHELRADINNLKSAVARLAREDSLQGLVDRWGVVEREISDLPKTLGSREEMLAVSDRLDNLQHAISSLPHDHRLDGIENQVRTLALAVEQIAEQGGSTPFPVETFESRFDELSHAIASISATNDAAALDGAALERIEARISAVSRILENDEVDSTSAKLDDHFSSLAARLNMIQEETANLRAHTATSYPQDAFDRIEQRIENIAGKIEHVTGSHAMPSFDEQFAAINERLQTLQDQTAGLRGQSGGIPSDVIDALGARIEQLGATIGTRENNAEPSNIDGVLTELNDRLVYVIDKVNTQSDVAQETAQSLISSLDTRMDEIARRIDENENRSSAVPSMDSLESRLEEIAQMLSSGGEPATGGATVDLSSLESQIAELTRSLNGGSSPVGEDNLMSAARAAADEAIERLGAGNSAPLAAELGNLTQDLKTLESLARDSDDRNSKTFEAIHDTLLKVVDHLSNLGEHINQTSITPQEMPASAHASAEPAMPMARFEVPDAPSMAPPEELSNAPVLNDVEIAPADKVPPKPRAKLSPAQAAAAAAQAALKDSNGSVRPTPPQSNEGEENGAENKSLLKGMAKRLRGEAPAAVKAMVDEPFVGEINDDADPTSVVVEEDATVFDEPIEPGAGGADLGEIMRRVREERAGGPPANAAPMDGTPKVEAPTIEKDDSGKSDFIAAARRAAQAAAADATVVNRQDPSKKSKGMSSLGTMLASRRKPILMGAGAILLALLALPLVRGYLAPTEDTSQVQLENTGIAAENSVASLSPEVEEQPTAEQVLEVEPAIVEEAGLAPTNAQPIAPELEIDPVETSSAPPQFEINIDEIPIDVGPIALREAAASGEAKALYIVGDYFTGGVPSQSGGDLTKAMSWYEKSAELGYAPAQYRVGSFYEKGLAGRRDLEAAKTWYQMGAEQGNAAAMHNLAVLFANGVNGTPDMESATRWFQKAAELGLKDSQFNLGILTAKGDGVPQSLTESYKWFDIAARTGDPDATAKRDEVAAVLSPEQLEVAKGASKLWKAKPIDEEANIVSVPDEWVADQATTSSTAGPQVAPEIDAAQMKKAVQNIQAILNNNGYDAGPIDGVMGGKTTTAIKAFQEANGLAPTGQVDQALVAKLIELNEKNNQS